ncbi:MAG: zinc-ribbon domain-containing protein [Rhizobiales bacterium]|nr:zinc-ribbon domain-containing protein [Hyphomicrobiales bacterium]
MIISCPSCATRYDMPASRMAADGTMIKCAACGQSWLEGRAIEVPGNSPGKALAVADPYEPDAEIRRLVEASREARDSFAVKRAKRRRRLAAWGAFAAAMTTPLVMAMAFPEVVVRTAPAAITAYEALGQDINIYGIDLRRIEMQHMMVDGTRVLAVKGEIANISGRERKIPWLRFGLSDDANGEVYKWTLDSGARPLRPGEVTNFVTRVASPPPTAKNLQIRFAHADEIGSTAVHE